MHQIRERLFLASLPDIHKKEQLISNGVNHILTVDSNELDEKLLQKLTQHGIRFDFAPMMDTPNFNLFNVIEDVLTMLTSRRNSDVTVVHCLAGVSRSVSVIIAFLMKTENLSFDQALEDVKAIKPDVCPNPGFEKQLRIFEQMGNDVNADHPLLRKFLMDCVTLEEDKSYDKIEQKYPERWKENLEISDVKCRRCRVTLSCGKNIRHFVLERCSSIFVIEPEKWMKDDLTNALEGKFQCKNCHSKLGSFKFKGTLCSCGEYIRPAFQLHKSKVDIKTK